MGTDDKMSGFEATMAACEKLGLDLTNVPRTVLQIFYNSGAAFADHGITTHEQRVEVYTQRQRWRDSVIWPRIPDQKRERPPKPAPE